MGKVGGLNGRNVLLWMSEQLNINGHKMNCTGYKGMRLMYQIKGMIKVLLLIFVTVSAAEAANTAVKNIEFSSLPNDLFEIHLTFDAVPPEPKGYTIEKPARIALDLVGVSSDLTKKNHKLNFANARSVTVLEAKNRTRVIISLDRLDQYSTRIEGNHLYVVVGGAGNAGSANTVQNSSTTPTANGGLASMEDIDFRRDDTGGGKIIVRLSDSNVNVDVQEEGSNILIRFSGAQLPERLRRKLDVTDFATPVVSLDATVENGRPVIRVQPKGEFQYLAYQVDNIFTLTVTPVAEDEVKTRRIGQLIYVGEKLSLNFQDIEVRSVLQLIADFTDLNLVASDTVSGRITLRLKNTPWDQALDLILKTKGLGKRQNGNVLMVAPAAEIAAREKLELQTLKQVKELAPLYTEFISVRYAKASNILPLLIGKKGVLSSRGTASVDTRTNILIIQDIAQKLAEVRDLLKELDIPVRQVSIEARIVVANADYSKDLGIKWGGNYAGASGNNAYTAGGNAASGLIVDLGVDKGSQSTFRLGLTRGINTLALELSALEDSGNGEVVSQPKILTADRQKARIESGTEIPYQEASSSGATSTSFKAAVLALDVTPQITPDDHIIMDLIVSQDSVGALTSGGVPTIDTNEITTQVLVKNGETVVLGGVFRTEDVQTETKTPFLGDIPYLGAFFKKTSTRTQKTELLIFITPRIVD